MKDEDSDSLERDEKGLEDSDYSNDFVSESIHSASISDKKDLKS